MRLLLIAALCATGCAQQCKTIQADRLAFEQRQVTPATDPHFSVVIPQKLIDQAIAAGIQKIAPKDVPIPGLGSLAQYISAALRIAPDRMAVQRMDNGRYQVTMDLDVKMSGQSLFKMAAATETEPTADPKSGVVELALRPDAIQSVTPSVPDNAGAKLADALIGKLPAIAKRLIPTAQVRSIAQGAVQQLVTSGFDVVRREVLGPMGELARFRFEMPDLPLANLALVNANGALRIDARTTLPVRAGLAAPALNAQMAAGAASSDRIEVRFATQTLVELVNHAMGTGAIASNYNMDGTASETGTVKAALAWASGAAPLKVDLWQPTGLCLKARVAAKPLLSLGDNGLSIGVENATIESVQGPPMADKLVSSAGAWAKNMWTNAANKSDSSSKSAKLSLGKGGTGSFNLAGVNLTGDTLTLGLQLGGKKPGS
jgi:hypothetical protein